MQKFTKGDIGHSEPIDSTTEKHSSRLEQWLNGGGWRVTIRGIADDGVMHNAKIDLTTDELQSLCLAVCGLDFDGGIRLGPCDIIASEDEQFAGTCRVSVYGHEVLGKDIVFTATVSSLRLAVGSYLTTRGNMN